MVTDGCIRKDCGVRLIREGVVIYIWKIRFFKTFPKRCKEVQNGFECGMTIENFNNRKKEISLKAYEELAGKILPKS